MSDEKFKKGNPANAEEPIGKTEETQEGEATTLDDDIVPPSGTHKPKP